MLDEKLSQFERGVIAELKSTTELMDLKGHEESFAKIENDIAVFYKEMSQLKDDFATQHESLQDWVKRISTDMKVFYDQYSD